MMGGRRKIKKYHIYIKMCDRYFFVRFWLPFGLIWWRCAGHLALPCQPYVALPGLFTFWGSRNSFYFNISLLFLINDPHFFDILPVLSWVETLTTIFHRQHHLLAMEYAGILNPVSKWKEKFVAFSSPLATMETRTFYL